MVDDPIFECMPIPYGQFVGGPPHYFTHSEADALDWTAANLTRDLEQITVEACRRGDVSTFAVRTFKPDGTDSGWRCWLDGTFVGAASLENLFGQRVAS